MIHEMFVVDGEEHTGVSEMLVCVRASVFGSVRVCAVPPFIGGALCQHVCCCCGKICPVCELSTSVCACARARV